MIKQKHKYIKTINYVYVYIIYYVQKYKTIGIILIFNH